MTMECVTNKGRIALCILEINIGDIVPKQRDYNVGVVLSKHVKRI